MACTIIANLISIANLIYIAARVHIPRGMQSW